MTKTQIDDVLQEFHEQLHMPLLDAAIEAYREDTPESLLEAINFIEMASIALYGIISVVEQTEALQEDQDVFGEVSRVAQSIVTCMHDLDDLAQNIAFCE